MRKEKKQEILITTKFGDFLCFFETNDPEPGFTVTSPAAAGFITGGRNLKEAKKMAKEGLEFHCECEIFERISRPRQVKTKEVARLN
jgi:predicted RNase H-like HicB family nuclease